MRPIYPELQAHSPVRPPDWRWRRAQALVAAGRYVSQRRDDADTGRAVRYLRAFARCQGGLPTAQIERRFPDLLVAHQSGLVCRLDAANGKERSRHEVGEPLAGPICLLKAQAYLSGSDGVIHRIPLPPRP